MKPTRCGYCDYCRATKRLFSIRPYFKLMPEFRDQREEDYAADEGSVLADPQEEGTVGDMPVVPSTDSLEKA